MAISLLHFIAVCEEIHVDSALEREQQKINKRRTQRIPRTNASYFVVKFNFNKSVWDIVDV